MSGDGNGRPLERVVLTRYRKVLAHWPTWGLVVLFLVLAAAAAGAGVLAHWLWFLAGLLFLAVALALVGRLVLHNAEDPDAS